MSRLTLSLFGSPSLAWDGVPIAVPARKALALLAYLVGTGVRQRRATLATLLWPESDRERSHNMLRTTLSRLRRALRGQWLVADRRTVGLDGSHEEALDVLRFRSLLAQCQRHGHGVRETCPDCLPLVSEAVELYGGDFMDGFTLPNSVEFDTWQSLETEALRQELVSALERLVQGCSAEREVERALAYAQRWLTADPLDEGAHRALMQLYAGGGQQTAALRQYELCERVLREELGVSPSEETRELYQAIREGRVPQLRVHVPPLPRIPAAPRHNLPAPLTPLIGREGLLAEISGRLQDPACRLLSLVGPGGSGKTRLALEAAGREIDRFTQGVFFVSLAPLESADAIVPTMAQALGLSLHADADPQQQLLDYLREKHMLLILDNFEHLLEGVEVVSTILRTAPQVKAMTTSRARLNARGEHLLPVPGLDAPSHVAEAEPQRMQCIRDLTRYAAIQLFLYSARRVWPDFDPGADELAHVADICRLVQGMPLAILLAASWMRMLTPAEIASEIRRQSLDFLETEWRDVPERQRTMRAVFAHSWGLLSGREHDVFAGLSVFRGGFHRATAQEITGASLRDLASLMDRSLLQRGAAGRYEVHELLRQYAAEELTLSGVETVVRDRHCAYFAAALEGWEADLRGPKQRKALEEMGAEIDNARAAWGWAVARGDTACLRQAMDGLCRFYERRGRVPEAEAACRSAAERLVARQGELTGEELRVLVRALGWQAVCHRMMGSAERARQLLERGLVLLDQPALADREPALSLSKDTRPERAFLLEELGNTAYWSDNEKAARCWEESLALYRELGDHWATANVLCVFAYQCLDAGELDRGTRMYQESLGLRRSLGDQAGIADSLLLGLTYAVFQGHEYEEGERLMREATAIWREAGDQLSLLRMRDSLSWYMQVQGRYAEAQEVLEEILALPPQLRTSRATIEQKSGLGWIKLNLGLYGEARRLCQEALSLARETGRRYAFIAPEGLGMVALAEGAYAEARELLQVAVAGKREIGVLWAVKWGLAALGHAERGLEHPAEARQCLVEALRGVPWNPEVVLHCLSLAALLLADRGEVERAIELYALAMRYPSFANSRYREDIAGKHIAALAATLPPQAVEAAEVRGRARDLGATVAELLEEFDSASKGL